MQSYKTIILLIYISVASFSGVLITPALPQIQADFNLANGSVEWLVNVFLIGYTIGQVAYSPIADKYGDIRALQIGFGINIIGVIICVLASYMMSFYMLEIGRLITALGSSAGFVCTFMIIKRLVDENKMKTILAYVPVSFALGLGIATLVGGLITYYISWTYCFYILLLHAVIMFVISFIFTNHQANKHSGLKTIISGYKQACKNRYLLTFSLCLGSAAAFNYCYTTVGGFISQETLGITIAEYSYWNLLTMVGIILGGLICAKIINKYDTKKMLIVILGLILVSFTVLAILTITKTDHAIIFFTMIAFLYFITSFIFPTSTSLALSRVKDATYASGAMSFINMMTAMICVAIMGYLPLLNIWKFIVICMGISGLCLALIFIFGNKVRKDNL